MWFRYTPPSAPPAFDASTVNFAAYEAEQAQIQQQLASESVQLGLTTQTQAHDQTVLEETNAPWLSASAIMAAGSVPLSMSTTDPMPEGPFEIKAFERTVPSDSAEFKINGRQFLTPVLRIRWGFRGQIRLSGL